MLGKHDYFDGITKEKAIIIKIISSIYYHQSFHHYLNTHRPPHHENSVHLPHPHPHHYSIPINSIYFRAIRLSSPIYRNLIRHLN